LHSVGFANGVGSERAEREKEGGKKIKIKKMRKNRKKKNKKIKK